ncbi:MAG: formyltetrahydrofolate deformylase [Rhodospirillales bacterium]|jgi:formyltetrahydrofolate deformylase|nr:formyltetrahydrofolate deformylase [Rhodospirillaceae bacterium]MDP6428766.1 formyltetrahydrofolate deformylase [Rhodospirillales bacterium]MDP6643279.1 formyltetrahydrofolate deformylase [Rhodospirillales bacterium]MDP6843890.1 formyltetrahydrofolate deformylase [Rhodospirillales bacterium]|tara:strand:+ start:68 stop:922 length:855 start_codon:yes stop_codon:yes gene_type:complete
MSDSFILTMNCPDRAGIVAATATCLADNSAFITETAHFADPETQRFFGRVEFEFQDGEGAEEAFRHAFDDVAAELDMDWGLNRSGEKCRILIMVSKTDHCLNDLLYRHRKGALNVDIACIASNHPDLKPLADWHGIPFHHLPVAPDNKRDQESQILDMFESSGSDLLVLARYMQILSPEMCASLQGRAINIHHSFLPGFKGARPYHQAHARGVKLIGATAHFVTTDLDEGPIIEQAVERVDHKATPESMIETGRDLESLVLARAVTYYSEQRVFLNGQRTIVFK